MVQRLSALRCKRRVLAEDVHRWVPSLLGVVAIILMSAWVAWVERHAYTRARAQVAQQAQQAAAGLSGTISQRLVRQFTELQFVATALLGPEADPARLDPRVVQTLRRFMVLHPDLYALNIQSPEGNTIEWSTQAQARIPITAASQFTPLPADPDFLLGQDQYSRRVGSHVITMRYRMRDASGQTRFFVGSPYLLKDLLRPVSIHAAQLPWVFVVRDLREGSVLGVVHDGRVSFPSRVPTPSLTQALPNQILAVQVGWAPGLVRRVYLDGALAWIFREQKGRPLDPVVRFRGSETRNVTNKGGSGRCQSVPRAWWISGVSGAAWCRPRLTAATSSATAG